MRPRWQGSPSHLRKIKVATLVELATRGFKAGDARAQAAPRSSTSGGAALVFRVAFGRFAGSMGPREPSNAPGRSACHGGDLGQLPSRGCHLAATSRASRRGAQHQVQASGPRETSPEAQDSGLDSDNTQAASRMPLPRNLHSVPPQQRCNEGRAHETQGPPGDTARENLRQWHFSPVPSPRSTFRSQRSRRRSILPRKGGS